MAKWANSGGAERANKDLFLTELCDVLEVPRPQPASGDPGRDEYVFEKDVRSLQEGGVVSIGRADLYKRGCFLLEAKQGSHAGDKKKGIGIRGTGAWNIAMHDAHGQALGYARCLEEPVPFLLSCDIGYCFDLYADFSGQRNYHPFPDASSHRLFFKDLPKHCDTLRHVFLSPAALDSSKRAAKVTQEIAGHLAGLAKALEAKGHSPDVVASFCMRLVFTMFSEDVGLLPEGTFTEVLEKKWLANPHSFPKQVEDLWRAMNDGGELFAVGKLLRFNGGLFKKPQALPLGQEALTLLLQAAKCDWREVEPAIFGTLLERALDAKERHRLGAHFTPRAYVERLVRPTIEEPLRTRWTEVQAEVRHLVTRSAEAGEKTPKGKRQLDAAKKVLLDFHRELASLRVLDPACGSGNFLYVALDVFLRLEDEVLGLLAKLGETQTFLGLESVRVNPGQFLGIEVKEWAKEISELVLWIGYLQWHFRSQRQSMPEPVLQDYRNIERRDAILAYDGKEALCDRKGKLVTRWDGETYKNNPVTGEKVPDETRQIPVYSYANPREAPWPKADFIVGNPPYIGARKIRGYLGDGYVDAIRAAYKDIPETVDLVMYWWHKAAVLVRNGNARVFGLITTSSIVQEYSRPVLERHLGEGGVALRFVIAEHPWVDSRDGAAVEVAMTVGVASENWDGKATIGHVVSKACSADDTEVALRCVPRISASLTSGFSVRSARTLRANERMCFQGIVPAGDGFKLTPKEVQAMGYSAKALPPAIRPYIIGKDLVQRPEPKFIVDFFGLEEHEAQSSYPRLFQHILNHVKHERETKRGATKDSIEYAANWWIFAKTRPTLRGALKGLSRFISTPYTAKHRPFIFVDAGTLPDAMAYAIASDDAHLLGMLSSRIHALWCLKAGGTLEDRPRYNSNLTFAPFPFPDCTDAQKQRIRDFGESLDAHRKRQQAQHPKLTITGMYNVLEKLKKSEALTDKEKLIHEQGLVSVLRKIQNDLDATVFEAYGWSIELTDEQILEKLFALNAERADEERRGIVRWLRPQFQSPATAKPAKMMALPGVEAEEPEEVPTSRSSAEGAWPKKLAEQISAVRDVVTRADVAWTLEQIAAVFKGAKRDEIVAILESLVALGLLVTFDTAGGAGWCLARANIPAA